MCPISFPFCVPLYLVGIFSFLLALGLGFKSALAVTSLIGIALFYISFKLYRRYMHKYVLTAYNKVVSYIKG